MKRLSIYSVLLLILPLQAIGQELVEQIPENALGVLRVDAERYSKKVDMDKVMQLDLFQMMDQQAQNELQENYDLVSKIYKQPKEAGVDLFPKSYAYAQMLDSLYLLTYLFKVSDRDKLQSFLESTLMPISQEKEIAKGKGYRYLTHSGSGVMMVSWTKKVAAFMFVEGKDSQLYDNLDYSDPDYYKKLDERRAAYNEQKLQLLMQEADRVKGLKGSNITANANFKKFQQAAFDVAAWLNANSFSEVLTQTAMEEIRDPNQLQMMQQLQGLNKDYYYHLGLNFNDGAVNLKARTFVPPSQVEDYAKYYTERPNPDFFNYIMGNNLLGMGSIAIDIKATVATLLKTYKPILTQSPEFGPMVDPSLKLLGIALDEDALANIFAGDLLFAITDVREVESTYIDYVYDDDFNMEKVEKTRVETQPIITAMASVGNEENFNKLMEAMQAYGFIKKEGMTYKLTIPNAKISPTFAVVDGILMATNDDQLMPMLTAGKSLKGKDQVGNDRRAEVLKHSQYYFINIEGVLQRVMKEENVPDKEALELLSTRLKETKLTGANAEDNFFEFDFLIEMKDGNTNAAMQLFQLANEFFLLEQEKQGKY